VSRESDAGHPHGEILALGKRRVDVLRIGRALMTSVWVPMATQWAISAWAGRNIIRENLDQHGVVGI